MFSFPLTNFNYDNVPIILNNFSNFLKEDIDHPTLSFTFESKFSSKSVSYFFNNDGSRNHYNFKKAN